MKLKQQQPSTPFVSQLTWMSILWIFLTKLNLHIVITLFHFFLHPAICQSFCRYIFPAFHRTVMFCWHKGFILLKLKILQHMFMKHTKKFTNYVTIEIEMKKRRGGVGFAWTWLTAVVSQTKTYPLHWRWSVEKEKSKGRWRKPEPCCLILFSGSCQRLNVISVLFVCVLQEEKTLQQQLLSQFSSQEEESQRRQRQREEPPHTQVTQPGEKVMHTCQCAA